MLNSDTLSFIVEHQDEETSRLLFAASSYPNIDMRSAVRRIEARKKIKYKIPEWYAHPELDYPFSISLEQCSSQLTAQYKQRFVSNNDTIADLTGGLGVDTYYMSLKCRVCHYFEKNKDLCESAASNFKFLECNNIIVTNQDSTDYIHTAEAPRFDLIYLDPARRDNVSKRVYSITDCEPDAVELLPSLFRLSDRVLIKVSPMADIRKCVDLFPHTSQLHIVSLRNECKEVLLLVEKSFVGETQIFAVNINGDKREESFKFKISEEKMAVALLSSTPQKYIYQPNKAILKSGGFKLVSERYNIHKLAQSTHLYTSEREIDDFLGKRYLVEKIYPFNRETLKVIPSEYPKAEVFAVNFPIDTNHLRGRLKIKDGGDKYLIACTLADDSKVIIAASLL